VVEHTADGGPWTASGSAEARVRVLHIEDDPAIADLYALGLEMRGFEVVRAGDGYAGVAAASAMFPDVLLIDLGLPLLDGLEVLDLLRQSPKTEDLPALFLTSSSPSEIRDRAAALGAAVLLKSETTPRNLCDAIEEQLGIRRQRL
jgi:CheY-like chemotaxis protein